MAAVKKLIVPAAGLILVIGAGAWYALNRTGHSDGSLHVSGNIETTEVGISFKIAGRVVKRYVDEGQSVRAGEPVAQLETADLQADLALRRAELEGAEAALAELVAGSRPDEIAAALGATQKAQANYEALKAGSRPQEIAASEAEFHAAEVERKRLKRELDRNEQLQQTTPGAITPDQLDQARAAYHVADQRFLQAMKRHELVKDGPRQEDRLQGKAAMEQAQAQYRLVKEGPRKEVIDQARAKVQQAKAAVQSAETKLGYATITSPLTGVVLSKNIEPGEYVAPGTPVVTVADLENVWLRAYIDERDLGKREVAVGDSAQIATDAYPDKVYPGQISFISSEQEFTPKSVQTSRERVKFVYRIKIAVKNPHKELKPGMPADGRIGGKDPK